MPLIEDGSRPSSMSGGQQVHDRPDHGDTGRPGRRSATSASIS
jgi:hypothetical protein